MKNISIFPIPDKKDVCHVIISDITRKGEKSSFYCPIEFLSQIVQLNLNF